LDADGDFVVGWSSSDSGGTDSDNASVHGQRYASDGSSVGAEFQVNTYTNNGQRSPSVSVDADGDLVVVWQSFGSTGTDQSSFSVQRTEGVLFVDGFESGDTTAWTSTSP
jgi:hypothetical protein